VTSANPCPDWHEEIPSAREAEFSDRLKEAIDRVEDQLRHRAPLDSDLTDLHRILFSDFVPLACYAGNYRKDSIHKSETCLATDVQVGGVLGAPYRHVEQRMTDLCHSCSEISNLMQNEKGAERALTFAAAAAYAIGEFIRIHPFINGNGRVSRLLWYWLCRRAKVSPMVQIHPRPPAPLYSFCMGKCMNGDDAPLALALLQSLASLSETPSSTE
jgi:fido (protein-threonine AMPylation protein)